MAYILQPLSLNFNDYVSLHGLYRHIRSQSMERVAQYLAKDIEIQDSLFLCKLLEDFRECVRRPFDFGYFTLCIWNFLTTPTDNIAEFVFSLYDEIKIGSLPKSMVHKMLLDIFNATAMPGANKDVFNMQLNNSLDMLPQHVSITEFKAFSERDATADPIVKLYSLMQSKILGANKWNELKLNPIRLLDSGEVSIVDFKSMSLFEALLLQGDEAFRGVRDYEDFQEILKESLDTKDANSETVSKPLSQREDAINGEEYLDIDTDNDAHKLRDMDYYRNRRNASLRRKKPSMTQFIVTANFTVLEVKNISSRSIFSISPNKIYPAGSLNFGNSILDGSENDSFQQSIAKSQATTS